MGHFTPVTVSRKSSQEERLFALQQIYRQVLERQPYIYERKMLAQAEKDFLSDKVGVRRFLRELGHSKVYLDSFYFKCSNLKFIELCFKHFMGRAPQNQDEVRTCADVLMHQGVEHLITTLLDSEEYRKVFGCFTVPHERTPHYYESPKAYLETQALNHEHFGQRGHVIPTMYWHELGLNCDAGVCRHPEVDEQLEPLPLAVKTMVEEELLTLLRSMDSSKAREVVSTLSPQQKDALRQAIRR